MVQRFPDEIVVLGIRPDHAEPGYGYIQPGEPLAGKDSIRRVASFYEKPERALAEQLGRAGWLWNSFVMVFRVSCMLEVILEVVPEEFAQMSALPRNPVASARIYATLPQWNFSHRILPCIAPHLLVKRVDDLHWSDWGTRELIERTLETLKQPLSRLGAAQSSVDVEPIGAEEKPAWADSAMICLPEADGELTEVRRAPTQGRSFP